jgi:ABC-type sugar transport system substrate-binding protein
MPIVKTFVQRRRLLAAGAAGLGLALLPGLGRAAGARLAYLTPGLDLPFWRILAKGISDTAAKNGATSTTYDSHNSAQTQVQNAQDAIARKVDGILISPTDSSTCPGVLNAAQRAGIPVVIADIGTTGGEYVSFIISNNEQGAYDTGKSLAAALKAKGWDSGTVGLVTISLARNNGKARTAGFRKAMQEAGIKEAALSQMQAYTADETFRFVQDMLTAHPEMRGLFIQTDSPTLGAVRAVQVAGRKNDMLIAGFDGIPEFVPLLQSGEIAVAGMQQPYLMGVRSAEAMFDHLAGKTPEKTVSIPIQIVDTKNLAEVLPSIKVNVFGET